MGPVERQGYAMNAQLETDQSPETPDEQSLAGASCSWPIGDALKK